ncbi:MAG: lectin-like protein, partial [Myxococcota bacterium]
DVSGVNLALRFYPDDQPTNGCSSGTCSEDACSDTVVPLAPVTAAAAPIDTQEQALFAALDARSPGGGTPSRVALGGAALAAERRALTNPRDRNVVIFVTDGQPTQCGTNEGDIQDEAGEAFDFYNVLTYAIGLEGVSQAFMDGIAEQGGTGSAFFISNNSTVEQQLLNALLAIQGTPIECNLNLPDINVDPFDPGSTVVTLEPGDGSIAELVQVSDVSQCAMGDWYFDDPVQPTVVTLCPTRCATANNPPSTCTGVGEFESPIDATCYLHDTTGRTFADAEALCEAWGGEVASITSFREQGFLERESGISTETWIGLRDEATEGIFQWTNRDAFSFENWDGGQPNGSTTQNCVAYLNGGVWHDRECTNSYQTLCERKASRSGIKVHLGCANGFTPSTFTEVYEATCPEGQGPQWGFFTYTSTAPAGSSIVFEARGAQTQVDLAAATYQPVATSQSTPVDTTNCALTGPAPTCPVNLFTTLTDVNDEPFLELRATLNPDQRFTPTLSNWQITYTCVPNQ